MTKKITINLERREDDGLHVSSPDAPGLILSGRWPDKVMEQILPALLAIKHPFAK